MVGRAPSARPRRADLRLGPLEAARCTIANRAGCGLVSVRQTHAVKFGAWTRSSIWAQHPLKQQEFLMANPDRSGPREMDKPLGTMEEIQRDIQTVRDDLARLAQQVGALLASSGSDALRRARQSLDGVIA